MQGFELTFTLISPLFWVSAQYIKVYFSYFLFQECTWVLKTMGASSLDSPFSLPGWNETAHARLGHAFAPRGVGKLWQNTRFHLRNSSCDWKWHLGVDCLPTINYGFDIWNHRSLSKDGIQCYIVVGISFEEDVVADWPLASHRSVCSLSSLRVDPLEGPPQNLPKTWGPHLSWPPPVFLKIN